jgi:16S rRNA processing protein RimM
MPGSTRICVGQVSAPHGLRGEVRLRSFTSNPSAIGSYGPLETNDGRSITIEALRPANGHFKARLSGISDRTAAERLRNAKLYIARDRLPPVHEADGFYHADLVGLRVFDWAGKAFGSIIAVHNFGAGDLIEVHREDSQSTQLLPFNDRIFPVVDIAGGRVVVDAPASVAEKARALRRRSTVKRSRAG